MEIEHHGFAAEIPFEQYPQFRAAWFKQHPKAKVLQEFKSLYKGLIEVPDPQLIGQVKMSTTMVIAWGVLYTEPKKTPTLEKA